MTRLFLPKTATHKTLFENLSSFFTISHFLFCFLPPNPYYWRKAKTHFRLIQYFLNSVQLFASIFIFIYSLPRFLCTMQEKNTEMKKIQKYDT